ncbi:urease accessory protein UreD [Roseomonas sp. PWR1]|uniref:Urease accessory protein UreD n=1 Tax=Roseomonas nitratireducens TaxID=2820810 RepID=A0ABS4AQH9_9PROT|nr:urease accessory protein UreD [Neoroseomonas nitratireducens]MBP0462822.1 urease accessory protein UreD [Neoroseomonas nitratireducens]
MGIVAAAPRHQRAKGGCALRFTHARGDTRLAHLDQASPMRILFPTPEPGEMPLAALVNTAGGLAGGDEVAIEVTIDPGARATLSTPAAEKIYRSLGPETRIATRLVAEAGALLEWIPQETILFEGARLDRRIEVSIAADATLVMAEMLVFGRRARDERFATGSLNDSWRVARDGRLLWADGLALGPAPVAQIDRPFGLGGAEALATLLLALPGDSLAARDVLREGGMPATIPRPGLVLLRWLGAATAVRESLGAAIRQVRRDVLGLPAVLPRLWTC